jgi:hypothetical protein
MNERCMRITSFRYRLLCKLSDFRFLSVSLMRSITTLIVDAGEGGGDVVRWASFEIRLGLADGEGGGDATLKSGWSGCGGARKDSSDARLNRCDRLKSRDVGALDGATARW